MRAAIALKTNIYIHKVEMMETAWRRMSEARQDFALADFIIRNDCHRTIFDRLAQNFFLHQRLRLKCVKYACLLILDAFDYKNLNLVAKLHIYFRDKPSIAARHPAKHLEKQMVRQPSASTWSSQEQLGCQQPRCQPNAWLQFLLPRYRCHRR